MQNLKINYQTLTDIINIKFKIFYPVKDFHSKIDFNSVVKKKRLNNGKFFPFPIFFSLKKKEYDKFKYEKKIKIYYNGLFVCFLKVNSFYEVDKKKIGRKIFKTSNLNHPGLKNFIETGNYNVDCEILKFNKKILKKIKFSDPKKIRKIILKKKNKNNGRLSYKKCPTQST